MYTHKVPLDHIRTIFVFQYSRVHIIHQNTIRLLENINLKYYTRRMLIESYSERDNPESLQDVEPVAGL